MAKRKSEVLADSGHGQPRRSTRVKPRPASAAPSPSLAPSSARTSAHIKSKPGLGISKSKKKTSAKKDPSADIGNAEECQPTTKSKKPRPEATTTPANGDDTHYWLLKAEPETRLENGIDVKFSIDDLAARTDPEPWDGIRNYAARNNLRAMKQGDLAFFYHSNCREPGIVGTMEIVQEHSPDLSAHDPKAPYYDASSKPDDPKWSVVHVCFRSKFAAPITLKQLREMGGQGKPLENMQMLKLTRMSVSKVSAAEWEHLMGIAEALPA